MIKSWLHIVFFSLFYIICSAQNKDSLYFQFRLKFNDVPIRFNQKYISSKKDTLSIRVFKVYLSNIKLLYQDESELTVSKKAFLLDFDSLNTLRIPISTITESEVKKIQFCIGIDSLTNISGAQTDDLDPIKGMYWAWQSGYINMKLEGNSSSCKTRKNEFQFHIGGYREPFYAIRTVEIPIQKSANSHNEINLSIDFAKLFTAIDLKESNSIMIPGKEAIKIADLIPKMFSEE